MTPEELENELTQAREALAWMVIQYMEFPEGYISHEFMSAQEDAIEYLERIGWLSAGQYERYYWTPAARAALNIAEPSHSTPPTPQSPATP